MAFKSVFQLSLRQRLSVGLATMLVPFALLAAGATLSFEGAIDSFRKQEDVGREVLFPLANIEGLLLDISSLATPSSGVGSEQTLDLYRIQVAAIDRNFETIESLPRQLPEQSGLVANIAAKWKQTESKGLRLFSAQTLTPQKDLSPESVQLQRDLKQILDDIQQIKYRLTAFQNDKNIDEAQAVREQVRSLVALIFLMALALSVICAYALSRSILVPLQQLEGGVKHLGEGDFTHRIHMSTRDEFAQLANTFNAMAARLAQTQNDLERLATLDGLTEVYNRREFNRWLTISMERSRRELEPVSLIMVDIDHFKRLNDNYGHQAGDQALQSVAQLLKQAVRPGDVVSRYGGEEFSVILPQATPAESIVVAERIRESIQDTPIVLAPDQQIALTASLGVSTFLLGEDSETSFLHRADQALYQAKESGRNQVCQAVPFCLNLSA